MKGETPSWLEKIQPNELSFIGHYLDGRASAVLGTHTHVMTADERISERGTALITDVGMTGLADGVIGCDKEAVNFLRDHQI